MGKFVTMKPYIPLLIFLLFSIALVAQESDNTVIELKDAIKSASTRRDSIVALLALAEFQYDQDFSNAKDIVNEAVQLIANRKDSMYQQLLAKAYVVKGVIQRREAKFPEALQYYLKAKQIYERQNDDWHVSDVYHNMGMVYRHQKDHDKAITFYKKSIAVKESIQDIHGIAAGYNMMGVSYR